MILFWFGMFESNFRHASYSFANNYLIDTLHGISRESNFKVQLFLYVIALNILSVIILFFIYELFGIYIFLSLDISMRTD